MSKWIVWLLNWSLLCRADDASWIRSLEQHKDIAAERWAEELIEMQQIKEVKNLEEFILKPGAPCSQCTKKNQAPVLMHSKIMIFMSFSIPDTTWISLSKELEQVGGTFIINGLPQNSFQRLSTKVRELQLKGVSVPIELNPELFNTFDVRQVPTFLWQNKETTYQLNGNVSLSYALDVMQRYQKDFHERVNDE